MKLRQFLNDPRRFDKQARERIAASSRMTPRVANRLLKRIRDLAQVEGESTDVHISYDVAERGLAMVGVDEKGLEELDRRVLEVIIDRFEGGPVGLKTIAAALEEDERTIADVVEPYLIRIGMLKRAPRGRCATALAYEHLGKPVLPGQETLS